MYQNYIAFSISPKKSNNKKSFLSRPARPNPEKKKKIIRHHDE